MTFRRYDEIPDSGPIWEESARRSQMERAHYLRVCRRLQGWMLSGRMTSSQYWRAYEKALRWHQGRMVAIWESRDHRVAALWNSVGGLK